MNPFANCILETLISDYIDDEYQFLIDCSIPKDEVDKLSDEEITAKINDILEQYALLDDWVEYYDLDRGYALRNLAFQYRNTMYISSYQENYDGSFSFESPELAESYEVTVTKYKLK